ncbi:MAG: RodZ domain-containing protein [Endomicrobiia bacterium]|nr:DUF4115 domain-containing protein [Endomicrobiaceae bacterium]MDD3053243.1 DUF4115 domain-containing protein [Endomicrobiaceae bacterium]MDD3922502.1 DUF4115 domain-containing protein [Endomicrobiaceae bacterium]
MNEIGKILQQARKKKRYSLEKVHKMTKIKESYIVGLENSDVDSFPAELYYKNFLKTYSKYLGLNPDEILKLYEQSKLIKEEDLFKQDNKFDRVIDSVNKYNRSKLIITIIISVVLFVFLLISNSVITNDVNEDANKQSVVVVEQSEPVKDLVPERTKQMLLIEANKNTWIRIDSDNKKIYEETLYAGKQYKAFAYDNFIIKIGNIEGVDVYFNDKKVDILTGASENKVNTITLKRS